MARKWLAHEIVQTSAMDCGPASLACLLSGYGIPASYGRLREACQTDLDGTSIDVLETTSNQLGLHAEQVMVPLDHLLLRESNCLPAILVTQNSLGMPHFVVLWHSWCHWIQVMDPMVGRRWMTQKQIASEAYMHTQSVPARAIDGWLRSDEYQHVLRTRLRTLGINRSEEIRHHVLTSSGWFRCAALDAAVRFASSMVACGAIRRGVESRRFIMSLVEQAERNRGVIPDSYWFVLPDESSNRPKPQADRSQSYDSGQSEPSDEIIRIRGVVLLRAIGPIASKDMQLSPSVPGSGELERVLDNRQVSPWTMAWNTLGSGRTMAILTLLVLILLTAFLSILELVFLRSVVDLQTDLGLTSQRILAVALMMGVVLGLLLLELTTSRQGQRLGRQLEVGFRMALIRQLGRLNDRYFQSRPISDMSERCHRIQDLRDLPTIVCRGLQYACMMLVTATAIAIFDPQIAWLVYLIALVSMVWPMLFRPWLNELDMRVRTHSGSLMQFYFDSMQGLAAIRAHVAESILAQKQQELLVHWVQSSRRLLRAGLIMEGTQMLIGIGLAGWLVVNHLHGIANAGGALLIAWWALGLPELGSMLAALLRQLPNVRNSLFRIVEPLSASENDKADEPGLANFTARLSHASPSAEIELRDVEVVAAGHKILQKTSLRIEAGSHVAIVGPSGSGKSTLLGLLLGWHIPSHGSISLDGKVALTAEDWDQQRAQTTWVDPAIQIWNQSLLDNLRYGSRNVDSKTLGRACSDAELIEVLDNLPQGMQSSPGEGGGLLSGGQAQRLRLGRGLVKPNPRLVLMDEAFRGLSRHQRVRLTDRVRQRYHGTTLLFVTHDMDVTSQFDRVLVIEAGQIVEDGSPGCLARNADSRYRQLMDSERQLREAVWNSPQWRKLQLVEGHLCEGNRQ